MPDPARPDQRHGVLVLNKPAGPTSTRCLEMIKRRLGQKKIGHAGTLDPMATGVLLVLLGRATKIAPYLLDGEKVYSGVMRLGVTTDTYDAEGAVVAEAPWEHLAAEDIRQAVLGWRGLTEQVAPPYSAAKHQGRPLYALAREGRETPVKTRTINISDVEVLSLDLPLASFRVRVSSGVYIRSLVHSLGTRLGCGATLTALLREKSRPFGLGEAHDLDVVLADPEGLSGRVRPVRQALPDWPRVTLTASEAALVRDGVRLPAGDVPVGGRAFLLDPEGRELALAEALDTDGMTRWAISRGLWD